MQSVCECTKLMEVPAGLERAFGYPEERRYRWLGLYFDPIIYNGANEEVNVRHNVYDLLLEQLEKARGDLQRFRLQKLIAKLENIHQNRIRQEDADEDSENPWRIADYGRDGGTNAAAVEMMIKHPRVRMALDTYYGLRPGGFCDLFEQGQAIILFDRLESVLYAGGDELHSFIAEADAQLGAAQGAVFHEQSLEQIRLEELLSQGQMLVTGRALLMRQLTVVK